MRQGNLWLFRQTQPCRIGHESDLPGAAAFGAAILRVSLVQRCVRVALGCSCSCDVALALKVAQLEIGFSAFEHGGRKLIEAGAVFVSLALNFDKLAPQVTTYPRQGLANASVAASRVAA